MTHLGRNTTHHAVQIGSTQVVLAWFGVTGVGNRRAANEDSVLAESPVFAVADGMGGHAAGDLASAAVVNRLAEVLTPDFIEPGSLLRALEAATADIDLVADDSHRGVGTTVTGAALVRQGDTPYFAVFNIGDSRVYRYEEEQLSQVTIDHSVVQELVDSGVIHPDDAEHHPDSNVITRAVGFSAAPQPDLWLIPIVAGMRLLLCSDGLTKEVPRDQLAMLMGAGMTPGETANELMNAALEAGGRDNVSIIVVDVLEAPEV